MSDVQNINGNLFQITLQSGSPVPDSNPTINVQFTISQVYPLSLATYGH